MNIYFGIKYFEDFSNQKHIEKITGILEDHDHKTFCVVRDVEEWGGFLLTPKELMLKTFEMIDKSELLIIEFTEKGTGLGIEAGYAFSRKIPIITIAKENSDISTTLSGISEKIIFYKEYSDLGFKLLSVIK
ncbi:2'-deoxynucleoside 5'-phosphate N-hydrolase 1 [compost metagenome]